MIFFYGVFFVYTIPFTVHNDKQLAKHSTYQEFLRYVLIGDLVVMNIMS